MSKKERLILLSKQLEDRIGISEGEVIAVFIGTRFVEFDTLSRKIRLEWKHEPTIRKR